MNIPSQAEQATKPLAPPSTSIQLLGAARDIQEQRARDYDQPGGERSMRATVQAFNIITRRTRETAITESEGWLLMQILKDVRDRSTDKPHRDSLEDGISYSSLKAEARLREVEQVTSEPAPVDDDKCTPRSPTDIAMREELLRESGLLKSLVDADHVKNLIKWHTGADGLNSVPVSMYVGLLSTIRSHIAISRQR